MTYESARKHAQTAFDNKLITFQRRDLVISQINKDEAAWKREQSFVPPQKR